MKISANGITLYYEMKGSGQDMVLVHGSGGNSSFWANQVRAFAGNYRVSAPDLRGHGLSDDPPGEYNLTAFVEDLYQFMKALDISNAVLAGFSMGGRIALSLARQHPTRVRALVLSNSSVGPLTPSPAARERIEQTIKILEKKDMSQVAENLANMAFSKEFAQKHPPAWDYYYQMCLRNNPGSVRRMLMASLDENLPPEDLSNIHCPTLMIQGDLDPVIPAEARQRSQRLLLGANLVVLHTGHASPMEAPDAWNKAVADFLRNLE
jgi:pimeloyl-ACP methyl ester carboxylesterase